MKIKKKKAQVWVETAIYTLIGLVIIAILLTAAKPQIEKIKDKGIVVQTMEAMNLLNNKIIEAEQAAGGSREIKFSVAKGRLEINSEEETIQYIMEDTRLELSEIDVEVREGDIYILTKERGSRFDIFLTMNYADRLDITFDNLQKKGVLQAGTTPYRIIAENIGDNTPTENTHINFNLI
tara:strand:+ start:622 stop:1161 length:540 start_codon:yes stop_codon:yes gene_type:complete